MTATLKLSSEMPSTDNVSLATVSSGDIIYVPSHVIGWKVIAETSGSVPAKNWRFHWPYSKCSSNQ
jgi:hypothetical protein